MNDVPVFITYRDRRIFLDKTLASYRARGFTDITVIDNDSAVPIRDELTGAWIVTSDNAHRQLAPWLLDLVPDDRYYIVADCDIELDCPCVGDDCDVCDYLIQALEAFPQIEKIGLGIRTDDLLRPPPQHYGWSYLMEYSVEGHFERIAPGIIAAPTDTHFAMHRPGSGWPGIVGARTLAPYLCRHLPWYEPEYTKDERLYYSRAGKAWTMSHSAETLLEMTVAVPFTELRAETIDALNKHSGSIPVSLVPLTTNESYWELLRDLWAQGKTFAIVEHDIVVNETTLDELRLCDHDWCAMPFPYRGEERAYSLACTKFSADLIAWHPKMMEYLGEFTFDELHPRKHWCRQDMWIYHYLIEAGEKRHEHERSQPVGHIGAQFPKHGCLS